MRFLGAKVILTPAPLKGSGMLAKAVELANEHGWFLARQFENEANADMHSNTTAPEILSSFPDGSLDYWITGYGTGGTLKGVSRVMRKESPNTKVVVCEPANADLLNSGTTQPFNDAGEPTTHPSFNPHPMQGWTPDFISKLTDDAVSEHLIDQLLTVAGPDAIKCSKDLALQEGIFCGISSGGTFAAALEVCKSAPAGSNILCMLPDTGERYLSTPLFEDISPDMSDEEIALSKSTPGYQFD